MRQLVFLGLHPEANEKLKALVSDFSFSTHVTFGNSTSLVEPYFLSQNKRLTGHSFLFPWLWVLWRYPSIQWQWTFHKTLNSKFVLSDFCLALLFHFTCALRACTDANGEHWGVTACSIAYFPRNSGKDLIKVWHLRVVVTWGLDNNTCVTKLLQKELE